MEQIPPKEHKATTIIMPCVLLNVEYLSVFNPEVISNIDDKINVRFLLK